MQRRSETGRSRSGDTDERWKDKASRCRRSQKAGAVESSDTDDRSKGEAWRCRRSPNACALESSDTDDRWKDKASRYRRSESVRSRNVVIQMTDGRVRRRDAEEVRKRAR